MINAVLEELQREFYQIVSPAESDIFSFLTRLADFSLWLNIGLLLVIFVLGRAAYDLITPFSLNTVLTVKDNKALSCSFSSYCAGLGMVVAGVYQSGSGSPAPQNLFSEAAELLLWSCFGIMLLLLAQYINDRLILRRFSNYSQIIDKHNLAAGLAESSSYISSGLILYATMQGSSRYLINDILFTLVYFLIAQSALVAYTRLYEQSKKRHWALHAEIDKNNCAAGFSFALSTIAFALMLSAYLANFDSLIGLLLWTALSSGLLLLLHVLIDLLFFPKVSLQREIAVDQNWGVSLIEGTILLTAAVYFSLSLPA